jgi:hypothetical protein
MTASRHRCPLIRGTFEAPYHRDHTNHHSRMHVPAVVVSVACSPKITKEDDMLLGRWVSVERDLNWKTGLWYLVRPSSLPLPPSSFFLAFVLPLTTHLTHHFNTTNLPLNVYHRRTRRFDAPLITDLFLLPESAAPPADVNLSHYVQAQSNFRDGV